MLISDPSDMMSVSYMSRSAGTLATMRNKRKRRKSRRALSPATPSTPYDANEMTTMKKSNLFHPSLMYIGHVHATILTTASNKNTILKMRLPTKLNVVTASGWS